MARHTAQSILQTVFGYEDFREPQQEIIEHVGAGGSALVIMPTGGGKSLCFQIPALLRDGVCIVVSPLIALMQDQVTGLRQMGVNAAYLNSTLTAAEQREVEAQMCAGELDLVYIAPERLCTPSCIQLLREVSVALFAIDEAHCVSQWGHDFRPEYLQLDMLAERFAAVPRIALTATADEQTRADIIERLHLQDAPQFISGFDRPNIAYHVGIKQQPRTQLLNFLKTRRDEAGIIYCLSRKRVEQFAEFLQSKGYNALPYHAGLTTKKRERHQKRFIQEEGVIIVATIAFGMGIDKPNVRFVAHMDLPKSIEAYYQETGRAGRDGLPATAWMVYGMQDVVMLRSMLDQSEAEQEQKWIEQRKLQSMLGFCETVRCRRAVLLSYFGDTPVERCDNCDTCTQPVKTWDGTEAAQKALSCVYRTGQRFGVGHVVDVLRGKTTDKITSWRHDQLSTYGIGADLSAAAWHSVFRQLVAAGYVWVDQAQYGSVKLDDSSRAVLSGAESVELRVDPEKIRSSKKASAVSQTIQFTTDTERQLWERLRALRTDLAKEQGVPPYVIFHDKTLKEMVVNHPRDLHTLGFVSGVGERKLQRYGAQFLEVLNQVS